MKTELFDVENCCELVRFEDDGGVHVVASASIKKEEDIFLIDHALTVDGPEMIRKQLVSYPGAFINDA